jgi:hypothetical protein
VALTGSSAVEYVIVANTCGGAALAPAATCAFDLTFKPVSQGTRPATATVSDSGGLVSSVNLTSKGL